MKATKLPSGKYRVQVVAGRDDSGKRIVKSFTAETEWQALKMADEYKKGIYKAPSEMTVYRAISAYMDSRSNILSPSTIKGYKTIREARLQLIRDTKLSELTAADIQRAVNFDAKRLSRKSIKSALALLKSALSMQDTEINLKRITLPTARKTKRSIPSAQQVIKAVIGSDIELPCLLAMWLSLRVSEVRGLQFRDISEDGEYISVNRVNLYIDGKNIVRDVTKTEESTRTNRLPKYLHDLIMAVPHTKDTDFIVPLSYDVISRRFKKLMTENGLEMTFHTLRHEFASTLNNLGVPSDYIQKLGGWSTDNVMKAVYTHTSAENEQKYQTVIDTFFTGLISSISSDGEKSHAEVTQT